MTLRLTTLTEHPDLDYRKRKIEVETSVYGDDHVFLFLGGRDGGAHVSGAALRDALLEAFPLPEPTPSGAADRLADWEKEVFQKAFSATLDPAVFQADKPKEPVVVPGTVFKSQDGWDGAHRVVLPDGKWYNIESATVCDIGRAPGGTVVFDPRDAVALPSPLGIRVGDTVRRVTKRDTVTETVEFEVNRIDYTGYIEPKYGASYDPTKFEVTSREVPDRLPAGTITRPKGAAWSDCLRTEEGWITLADGEHHRNVDEPESLEDGVRRGALEVIYLPES